MPSGETKFKLKYKDMLLAIIVIEVCAMQKYGVNFVKQVELIQGTEQYLPFALKQLPNQPTQKESLVEAWLINRANIQRNTPNDTTPVAYMMQFNACSIRDCYWTCKITDSLKWRDVSIFKRIRSINNQEDNSENGSENGSDSDDKDWQSEAYNSINHMITGHLEKCISRATNGIKLTKLNSGNDIISISEMTAHRLYVKTGLVTNQVSRYIYSGYNKIIGLSSSLFTNESTELVTGYDILRSLSLGLCEQLKISKSSIDTIVATAEKYGVNPIKLTRQIDIMLAIDYILNIQRNTDSIGFIRKIDAIGNESLSIAPVFNSDTTSLLVTDDKQIESNKQLEVCKSIIDMDNIPFSILEDNSILRKELNKSSTNSFMKKRMIAAYINRLSALEFAKEKY